MVKYRYGCDTHANIYEANDKLALVRVQCRMPNYVRSAGLKDYGTAGFSIHAFF